MGRMNWILGLIIFLTSVFVCPINGQTSATVLVVTEQYLSQCADGSEYFDTTTLKCVKCPTNTVPDKAKLNCRCNSTSRFTRNNGGGKVACDACGTNLVQSADGWACVEVETCTKTNGYLAEADAAGTPFVNATTGQKIRKCLECDNKTLATPDGCVSCLPFVFTESTTFNISDVVCAEDCKTANTPSGVCIVSQTTTPGVANNVPTDFSIPLGGTNTITSWFLTKYAFTAYLQCRTADTRNITACQLLANLCALINNVQTTATTTRFDVCNAFRSITTPTGTLSQVMPNVPVIDYNENYGQFKTLSESQVQLYLSYDKAKCQSKKLSFVAAKYRYNGEFISYGAFDLNELDICSIFVSGQARPANTSFITINYAQSCTITVEQMLKLAPKEPVFYELFLKYQQTSGAYALLPVPIINLNYRERDIEVNRGAGDSSRLQRRFYLLDQFTTKTNVDDAVQYIRYAKAITIQYNLFKDSQDGRIYPPNVVIDYGYVSATNVQATVSTKFAVEYRMNLDTQVRDIWISVGVLSFFALLWSFIRTWIWNKRTGKQTLDIVTIFKFLMYLCSSCANVFFAVLVGVCIWWLIFFKGQDLAFVLIPQGTQLDSIQALLIIGFVLKIIDVLHMILVQVSFDVFLIDWEKPKVESGSKGAVSCWRTLFVANEWNEIQTYRKTNTTLQLVFTLLFLKVVNLEAICTIDCNTSVVTDQNVYQAPYSPILRVGMAASIYILIGLAQWLIFKFIYSRCVEDKLGQFCDFCSVANISMFVLSHAQYGYYIHGKSPNGNADTSMKQMVLGFEKEEHDLVAKRGLLPDRNNQIFSMAITNKLRNQYSKVMQPLYERRAVRPNDDKARSNKQINAYEQLNRFLMSFIEHSLRDIDYIVTKRNFVENILDLEFREPAEKGFFYEDDGPSFENVVFAGKERTLFVFDLLVFLFVDYFAQNYILAAFFVYLVSKIVNIMRSDLGKMNLSRKTLVDRRFLI